MKQCPQCQQTYKDDLNFCLSDGAALFLFDDGEETVIRQPQNYNLPPTVTHSDPPRTSSASSPNSRLLYGIILVLAVLAVGSVVALYYERSRVVSVLPNGAQTNSQNVLTDPKNSNSISNSPSDVKTPVPLPNSNPNSNRSSTTASPPPANTYSNPRSQEEVLAIVVTKNRSGLHLRQAKSLNSSSMVFAPEGAEVTILYVDPELTTVNGNPGRWCWARYGGREGWGWGRYLKIK